VQAIESEAQPSPPEPTRRQIRTVQATIFEVFAGHQIGCELKAISVWLDGERALIIATWRGLDHFKGVCLVGGGGTQPGAVRPPQTDTEPTSASRIATAIRSTQQACRCTPAESPQSRRYLSAKRHLKPSAQTRRRP
jgi:hypothetical protein